MSFFQLLICIERSRSRWICIVIAKIFLLSVSHRWNLRYWKCTRYPVFLWKWLLARGYTFPRRSDQSGHKGVTSIWQRYRHWDQWGASCCHELWAVCWSDVRPTSPWCPQLVCTCYRAKWRYRQFLRDLCWDGYKLNPCDYYIWLIIIQSRSLNPSNIRHCGLLLECWTEQSVWIFNTFMILIQFLDCFILP